MKTSMIITTHNRAHLLDTSLRRLQRMTLPDEILVIDDGGDDNTEQVCITAMQYIPRPIRYVYNDNPGQSICSMARNIGAGASLSSAAACCANCRAFEGSLAASHMRPSATRAATRVSGASR